MGRILEVVKGEECDMLREGKSLRRWERGRVLERLRQGKSRRGLDRQSL